MWLIEIARAIYPIENKDMPAQAKIDYDEVYVQQVLTQDKLAMKYGYQSTMELKQVTFAKQWQVLIRNSVKTLLPGNGAHASSVI